MKVLLDIKDNKAPHLTERLKALPYMKAKTLNSYKGKVLEDLKEAIDELNLIKAGKLKARNAEDLFGKL